jgi:ribosomal protein RSM22 (predicted rRNA methylase)
VTTGTTAFDTVFGEPCFDWLAKHPDESAVFNEGMVGFSSAVGDALVSAYDFSKFQTLVDVGGGHGAILLAVLKAFPNLRGVVFDAPHVVEGAAEPFRAAGVADRCTAVGGNFFESVPASDAYILKHIIHDWNDADAGRILTAIRKAAQPGAKLLLVEAVIPPGDAPHFAKIIDLEMMLIASGQERTEAEYRALLAAHGFRLERMLDTKSPMNVIEAVAV